MERKAVCKNVGVCSRANKVQIITDDDAELKCPECGEEMQLLPNTPPPPPPGKPWKKIAIAAVAAAAIGTGIYFAMPSGNRTEPASTGINTTAKDSSKDQQPENTVKVVKKDSAKVTNTGNDTAEKEKNGKEKKPTEKTHSSKAWASYASFNGTTMTFKKAHRIPGTSKVAQPGDQVTGVWDSNGEVNSVRWYHADGTKSEVLSHE